MEETFGQRLARIRREKGMTQEDIASKVTISPQAVSKWENDLSTPDIYILNNLADILGVSVDELLGREKKEPVESEVVSKEEGICIKSGDKRIDIDDSGVHIHKNGKEITRQKREDSKFWWISTGTLFAVAALAYILLGLFTIHGWAAGWIVFFFPLVISSIGTAIRKKRFCAFAYPIFITAIYLTLGFLGTYIGFASWNVYWFLFITIPVFYLLFGEIDKHIHRQDGASDDDEDDEDDDDEDDEDDD